MFTLQTFGLWGGAVSLAFVVLCSLDLILMPCEFLLRSEAPELGVGCRGDSLRVAFSKEGIPLIAQLLKTSLGRLVTAQKAVTV